jgi:hypothetical protein
MPEEKSCGHKASDYARQKPRNKSDDNQSKLLVKRIQPFFIGWQNQARKPFSTGITGIFGTSRQPAVPMKTNKRPDAECDPRGDKDHVRSSYHFTALDRTFHPSRPAGYPTGKQGSPADTDMDE